MRAGWRQALACGAWMLAVASAGAGTFAVSPVRVTLPVGQRSGMVTVSNSGGEPMVVQVEPLAWAQQDGRDLLEPTRELLASPPVFQLAAGGSQVVRVGLRNETGPGASELSYRLLLKEVPSSANAPGAGLHIALNISLPVFVLPRAEDHAVQWTARQERGRIQLEARNGGNMHLQLIGLRLPNGDPLPDFAPQYLLPGTRRVWQLPPARQGEQPIALIANTDAGEMRIPIEALAH